MRYGKPAKTFEEQADLLLNRGLIADRDALIDRLRVTNYFRLTAYLLPFRIEGSDDYLPDTTLDKVWSIYTFDRKLRKIVLDAIELVEVFTRTHLAYHFAHDHGEFAYNDPRHLPNLGAERYSEWHRKLADQVERSKQGRERFVLHFFDKYGDAHAHLPIWMLVELMDFGSSLTFFKGVRDDIKKRIASHVGVPDVVLESWLLSLNTVRNRCAHHARLWDWRFGTPPKIPTNARRFPGWQELAFPRGMIGIILTICHFWIRRLFPDDPWKKNLFALFDEYRGIDNDAMGLPAGWRDHPLWRD